MNPGELVKPKWVGTRAYGSIEDGFGDVVGTMEPYHLGVVLDADFSITDKYYYQVLMNDGKVGWINAELLETIR